MSVPLVTIIILNFNGGNVIQKCLESIYKTSDIAFEVILIDNNSKDESQRSCKEKFPDIVVIQNKENLGMGARTIGIKEAKGDYIVFLDYDTTVESNWLKKFIQSYEQHGVGLYQPKLLELKDPQKINSAGNMINPFGLGYSRGKGQTDDGQYDKFQQISYTSGACTFTSAETMRELKEVDPIFFLYHDDLDFGWRANLMGISSYYEPSVIVYHHGSPNLEWSALKFYYLERNRWICLKSLYSEKTLRRILPYLILFEIGIFFFFLSKGLGLSKIKSGLSIIGLGKEIKEKREKTKKIRTKSDSEVVQSFTTEFYYPENIVSGNKRTAISRIINYLSKKAMSAIQSDN